MTGVGARSASLIGALAWATAAVWTGIAVDRVEGRGPWMAAVAICTSLALARVVAWLRHVRDWPVLLPRLQRRERHRWVRRQVLSRSTTVLLGFGRAWTPRDAVGLLESERARAQCGSLRPQNSMHGLVRRIGRGRRLGVPVRALTGNMLLVGAPGTGKSALMVLLVAQAIHRGDSVIVIDPKGSDTLRNGMAEAAQSAGRELLRFEPSRPDTSIRLDPLASWRRPSEVASRICALLPRDGGNDPFVQFAWLAIGRIVDVMVFLGEPPALRTIAAHLRDAGESLLARAIRTVLDEAAPSGLRNGAERSGWSTAELVEAYRRACRSAAPIPEIDALIANATHDRVHFHKMVLSVLPLLHMLTAGALGDLLSPHDGPLDDPRPVFDGVRLIRQQRVLYVGLESLADATVGRAIGSILLADLAAAVGERYRAGDGRARVCLFVDEAGEVANGQFVQLLNKGREAGFASCFAVQTLADLEVALGSAAGAAMMMGNAGTFVAFRSLDADTRRLVAEKCGRIPVKARSEASGVGRVQAPGTSPSYSATRAQSDAEIDAVPEVVVGSLPDLHFILVRDNGSISFGRVPILRR